MKHSSPYQRGVRADMARGFQGPNRGLLIWIWVDIILLLGFAVFCLVGMVGAEDTRSLILFGVFFLASFLSVGLLKLGYFQRLDRLAILDALQELRDRKDA